MAKATKKTEPKSCFVIMPISDPDGYDEGHFGRVYSHLIKPACVASGVEPVRADDVKNTNYIVIDILKRIINSDIVVCDLRAKNPNVLYELGIRQAFNLPSVLIKDKKTSRVFDIQGLRTVDYDENLRVDVVEKDISSIQIAIKNTIGAKGKDVNSLIQLLGVHAAELSAGAEISAETTLILDNIRDISQRMTRLEDSRHTIPARGLLEMAARTQKNRLQSIKLPSGDSVILGDVLNDGPGGALIGKFMGLGPDFILVKSPDSTMVEIKKDDDLYKSLAVIPF